MAQPRRGAVQPQNVDHEEFIALVARNERRLRAFIATLLGRSEDIDEVVQNTTVVAWRKLRSFSYQSASPDEEFLRWLCGVARYEFLAYRRRHRAMCVPLDEELIGTLAEMHLEAVEYLEVRHRALHDCLERLRSCDRDLICSRYGRDVPARDIATAQGRSLQGVYRSLARIRGTLLDCIERKLKHEGGP